MTKQEKKIVVIAGKTTFVRNTPPFSQGKDMKKEIRDKDLQRVEKALLRAGIQARKIAEQTNTPLIFYKDGQVVKKYVGVKKGG